MSILGVIIACIISAGIGCVVTKVIIYAALREIIRDNPKLYEAMRETARTEASRARFKKIQDRLKKEGIEV